jgi:exosortase/archaeosortase family protein
VIPAWLAEHRSLIVRSLVYVAFVVAVSNLILLESVDTAVLGPIREAIALATAPVLELLGVSARVRGTHIYMPGGAVEIANNCVAIDLDVMLAAAMLIYPASLRAKLIGVALAVVVMEGINFARVIALCLIVNGSSATAFDVGHVYVWPAFLILTCVATLLLWIQLFAHSDA